MEDSAGIDLRVWGKQRGLDYPYPLVWHLVDAAAAVLVLWTDYLTPSQRRTIADGLGLPDADARLVAAFWAGLHDIGKCMPVFQGMHPPSLDQIVGSGYTPVESTATLRHDRASHLVLYSLLQSIGYGGTGSYRPAATPAFKCAQVLGGHHGRFQDVGSSYLHDPVTAVPGVGSGLWHRQRELLVDALHEVLGKPPVPTQTRPVALVILTGVVILADWLVSQEGFLKQRQGSITADVSPAGIATHLEVTQALIPGLLAAAGLVRPLVHAGKFTDAFSFSPNALQHSIIDETIPRVAGSGLLVIAAAPGEGKTEAALHAAEALAAASGAAGCYFGLPTMATADQMYLRMRSFTERRSATDATLTLLHSMSWLNPAYTSAPDVSEVLSDDPDAHGARVTATAWLRGPKRGLFASFSVGTVDHALMAVLPVKHNALRLLALSGKVFVVDEAHAYDAYMQFLLRRLLGWLGALGCPVVLMSATLPSRVSQSLVTAYLRGAGSEGPDWAAAPLRYPGWLFVPADGGQPIRPSASAVTAMAASRNASLRVDMRPVRHRRDDAVSADPLDRLGVVRDLLAPIADAGGCVAVICNTVADAQRTYVALRAWARQLTTPPDFHLLHARFPASQRQEITERIATLFGKNAADARPRAAIVVATQVIEQSLDLDFDLVVSDLAPIALLLQRAGRCWRHAVQRRPLWTEGPRLVVLDPIGADGQHVRPAHWGQVYAAYLLRSTHEVFHRRGGAPVAVPGDVQELVEQVYCPAGTGEPIFLSDDEQALRGEWDEYEGGRLAHEALAGNIAINEPARLGDLSSMTDRDVPEAIISTRLGADSRRVVCCYVDDDGGRWLDPHGESSPLPDRASGRFSPAELTAILQNSAPVRESDVVKAGPDYQPPPSWENNGWLRELLLLPHRTVRDGSNPVPIGNLALHAHPLLGISNGAWSISDSWR